MLFKLALYNLNRDKDITYDINMLYSVIYGVIFVKNLYEKIRIWKCGNTVRKQNIFYIITLYTSTWNRVFGGVNAESKIMCQFVFRNMENVPYFPFSRFYYVIIKRNYIQTYYFTYVSTSNWATFFSFRGMAYKVWGMTDSWGKISSSWGITDI